jgi:hypothetical protein
MSQEIMPLVSQCDISYASSFMSTKHQTPHVWNLPEMRIMPLKCRMIHLNAIIKIKRKCRCHRIMRHRSDDSFLCHAVFLSQ